MKPIISVENLSKHFGSTKAVNGLTFSVEAGEIFGFLGPNGAGKTTTIRCMMDFIRPTGGAITIHELDAQKDSVAVKEVVGYLAPDVRLYPNWTGEEHIRFVLRQDQSSEKRGKAHATVRSLVKRLQMDTGVRVKSLSSGNKQKLGLLLAFLNNPRLLILDEPTVALDPLLQQTVYTILSEYRERGVTTFLSSHNLSEVERICNRVAIIRQGSLVAIESIDALRQKKMHVVDVRFTKALDPKSLHIPHVEIVAGEGDHFTLKVSGDLNPTLQFLSSQSVADVEITHASLEEIFLSFYEKGK